MEHVNPLGEEKISKLLLRFSLPATVGMLVNALYNVADRIFIGNSGYLGTDGLAGITICFPIMIILLSIGLLFGIGGATLFSIRLGEKKKDEAENALGNAFVVLILTSLLFMVAGHIFLKPILILFGADEDVLPFAAEYMRVIFSGAVFQIVSIGMNNFIRADGNPNIAMFTMLIGAVTNMILDPLFIYAFKMGMTGAALATIIAQFISAVWVVSYFFGKRSRNKLKLMYMRLKFHIIIKIAALGLPNFLMQIANSFLNITLNKSLLLYGGNIAVSGMGIINSLQTLLLMPVVGIQQGVQPIISFNFGAQKYDRSKTAVKLAMMTATVIVIIGFAVTRLFPQGLISLFNRDPELLRFGKNALLTWFMFLPVVGFQLIGANFFQAIGKFKSAMFLILTRQLIFLVPAILIFSRLWGLEGLLYSAPFADLFATILTAIWFYRGIKRLGEDSRLPE